MTAAAEIIIGQKQMGNVMMHDMHVKLNTKLPWRKRHVTKRLFTSKLDLINLRKKLVKWYIWSIACVMLKIGHFGSRAEVPGEF